MARASTYRHIRRGILIARADALGLRHRVILGDIQWSAYQRTIIATTPARSRIGRHRGTAVKYWPKAFDRKPPHALPELKTATG